MDNWKKIIWNDSSDFVVSIAQTDKIKKDCPFAVIPKALCWQNDSFKNKLKAVIKFKYQPTENLIQKLANEIFHEQVFGKHLDLGNAMFDLAIWHHNRDWELNHLTKEDSEKADALEAMTNLSLKRYWEFDSAHLKLRLFLKQPMITPLVFPMVVKTPIKSIQYFIDTHSRFIFNSIRKANHKYSEDLIYYLYELLVTNQKTANSLHNLVGFIHGAQTEKKDAVLTKFEIDAASEIDKIIAYLKSSIEKNVIMLGYSFSIPKLEDGKKHSSKLKKLYSGIKENAKKQDYFQFIEEFMSPERLTELNNYRTGLLHKKGISKLQPHSYFNKENAYKQLNEVFYFAHDQFCKNCTMIIASFALLTDELVYLDKPEIKMDEIPFEKLIQNINEIKADNTIYHSIAPSSRRRI